MSIVIGPTQTAQPPPQPGGQPTAPPVAAATGSRQTPGRPRVLARPQDVLALVLRQIDAVNVSKDELTIALKGLMDLTKQLAQAYATQAQAIQTLQRRVQALEAHGSAPTQDTARQGSAGSLQNDSHPTHQ